MVPAVRCIRSLFNSRNTLLAPSVCFHVLSDFSVRCFGLMVTISGLVSCKYSSPCCSSYYSTASRKRHIFSSCKRSSLCVKIQINESFLGIGFCAFKIMLKEYRGVLVFWESCLLFAGNRAYFFSFHKNILLGWSSTGNILFFVAVRK